MPPEISAGCGAPFGVWDASSASVEACAVPARGAARPVGKLSTTMTTDPDGKPYAHNAEQAEAHKLAAISDAAGGGALNEPTNPAPVLSGRDQVVSELQNEHRKGSQ